MGPISIYSDNTFDNLMSEIVDDENYALNAQENGDEINGQSQDYEK